jgi:hypothetical protein
LSEIETEEAQFTAAQVKEALENGGYDVVEKEEENNSRVRIVKCV